MVKKFILLTSFVLVFGLAWTNAVMATAIDIGIADDIDDVEERLDRGNVLDITSSDLELPYEDEGQGDLQVIGLRYTGVAIPKGAMITAASVQFQVDETKGGTEPVNVIIEGELAANSEPFADAAFSVTSRARTTSVVSWSVPNWTNVGDRGPDQATPDLAAIIQEIVNQDGWASGNSLVLIISNDPANPSTGIRCAEAGPGDDSATLHIEFGGDPFLQDGGADSIVSIEAENFHNKTVGQSGSEWVEVGPMGNFTGVAGMQVADGTEGTNNTNYAAESARLDFEVTFLKTGTHYVWVRAWGPDGSGDSCHAGLDGQEIDTSDRMSGWNNTYRWSNDTMDNAPSTFEVTSGGVHVVNIWMREDGLVVDKIVLTTNPDYVPTDDGPPESPRGLPVNAYGPVPADGAIDVDTSTLEWTGADNAVAHRVYLSTDEVIEESELLAETNLTVVFVELTPGATYYWRVDEVAADGTVYEGMVWSFSTLPLEAHFPNPADGATDLGIDTKLSWTAGKKAIMHDVYFGTDQAAVAAADPSTFKGKLLQTSFDPGPLVPFATYYWRVDEFTPFGTNVGPVWSFSTVQYLIIATDETTLNYDNTAEPYVSEVAFDVPTDLTYGGVSDLTLRFHGGPGQEGSESFDATTGTYDITGSGADVWGTADQFHYVYRELSGDATIVARVVSNGTGSNLWAKGGVMIRQSLAAGSQHAIMAITGGDGGGGAFQWRPAADGSSSSAHDTAAGMAPGYWVKLERVGNAISGSYSADGVTWTQQGTAQTIDMTDPVLIGLFVTSHAAGQKRTYTFDNVTREGNISADDMGTDIGIPFNTPAPIYVAIEDTAGATGLVLHADPAATMINQWWKWKIPLSAFSDAGVNLASAAKLYFGVGDGQPGGTGTVRVDDILVVQPVVISGADVTAPGDNVKGVPNDGDWPSAETPPLAIDDNTATKYLHFKGETQPTGFVVEPQAGLSVVTGLTFTTANDATERDPIAYELYGSNESIDGPYELIAAGDIVDFAGQTAWPRFTKNTTPITFDNSAAYKYYQVMFPVVRDSGSANSMQIAEVELIGTAGVAGPVNLLPNGGFEDGQIGPYGIYGNATSEVVTDCVDAVVPEGPAEGSYCLHIVVPTAGTNNWDVGMTDGSHTFKAGKTYTFSALLKCKSGTLDFRMKPERGASPWEGYNDQVFTMTDTWQEFSVTTDVIPEDVTPASPTFHFAFAAGDFWVDNVRLYEN